MNIEQARETARNADERYKHDRLKEMLKDIEDCTRNVKCTFDPSLKLDSSDNKHINFYKERLRRGGYEPYVKKYDGSRYFCSEEYLKVKNTWRSSPTDS